MMLKGIEGSIREVLPIQTFGSKGFRKRTVVVEVMEGHSSRLVAFEFTNDNADRVDERAIGSTVVLDGVISSRKWVKDGRTSWFTSVEAKDVKLDEAFQPAAASFVEDNDDDDDIPF